MDQITYIMSEIARLRIENDELKKNIMVRQNIMRAEPPHYRSRATMSEVMFSDNKGFEQFASPDYGDRTRAEKFGFMGAEEDERANEERKNAQRRLHKFSNYPIGIGNRFFC